MFIVNLFKKHFNVKPRQILYEINHLGFIYYIVKSFFSRNKTIESQKNYFYKLFQRKFFKFTNINNIIPLSRARLGIYLFLKGNN